MRREVIFLFRAYNDLDCRLPLVLEFARDARYKVSVIGVPSNNGFQDPQKHELYSMLSDNNVRVLTIYDRAVGRPFLKMAFRIYVRLDRWLDRLFASEMAEHVKRAAFKIVLWLSLRRKEWIQDILQEFRSAIVFLDEIAFHHGRSFFIDELLRRKESGAYSVYSFLAGQDAYVNLIQDKRSDPLPSNSLSVGIPLFVPGPNDKRVMQSIFPGEKIEVIGNTRFDVSWVHALSTLASKRIQKIDLLKPSTTHKIVFMLSKIEYGVDAERVREVMNACAALTDSRVIVKPHTRGMLITALGSGLDARIINGTRLSSSDLIEWADTILFTGSSIAFQAIQLKKKVIFLKYCQRYKSIFDDGRAVLVAQDLADTMRFIASSNDNQIAKDEAEAFLLEHIYNGKKSGRVCESVKSTIENLGVLELA